MDSAKSGTESVNCPVDGFLCDMNHINIGGREVIDVIYITKYLCKKATRRRFSLKMAFKCE
ncbi:TPA: hypothetical protein GE137_23225 [Escherichia coli]|uniref:Uncharacterized protein n=1 Tax=Escherichia coli TaxID=562 RepID=A0A1Q6B917_ECOLX|nr:hypothetical protein [Escherichia coli]OYK61843.1 hypothetical protein CI721_04500 [Shigella sonnei]EEY5921746.1 hypothetical protein [Escherichia coli]EFA4742935.1 hypothetical protein [Escherichia coli]EGO6549042.1 hypothetical protein [Escherichia coli]